MLVCFWKIKIESSLSSLFCWKLKKNADIMVNHINWRVFLKTVTFK